MSHCSGPACSCDGARWLACGGCATAGYCSLACQRAHWSSHQPACGSATLPPLLQPYTAAFAGETLTVYETVAGQPDNDGSSCPTGAFVWPCAVALLDLLSSLAPLPLPGDGLLIDLSAGVGLVSCALALLCSHSPVLSLDLPSALPLLQRNLVPLGLRSACLAYAWGQPLPPPALAAQPPPTLASACDLLHCAVRDGLCAELAGTLAQLAAACQHGCLVAWQPRSAQRELDLLASAAAALPGLVCDPPQRLPGRRQHRGVGHPEGAIFLPPSLFPEALEEGEEEEEEAEGNGVLYTVLRREGAPRLTRRTGEAV
jgi:hypothetical protein